MAKTSKMVKVHLVITVLFSIVMGNVNALMCDDVSTQACQLLAASKPDLCNDTTIATTTCPRFCGNCGIECYQCDLPVFNATDCNTTQLCEPGEVCMLKELKSSVDRHREFIMTCEAKTHCDGTNIEFPFVGKRSISSRDLSVKCCESDYCNYPAVDVPLTTQNPTTSAVTSTSIPQPSQSSCLKDVIFIVDESITILPYQSGILNFLASLVGDIGVSLLGTHVSMSTYSLSGYTQFPFNQYYDVRDLQTAIRGVKFRGGFDSLSAGLAYVINKITTPTNGDRANVPDAMVLVTDHTANNFLSRLYERQLQTKVPDIIAIGISGRSTSQGLQQIATDSGHVLMVTDSSDLNRYQSQIAKLICS